ncbi:MAG TPA: BTAD domain-containing putative transcriptional regulator [Nocardioidaceae bacterium]
MQVEIRLLGGFEVVVDGEQVPAEAWRRRGAASLVKLLALQPGHRLLRDQVMDALWPDLLVDEAAPRLHKAAHFARSVLGHGSVVLTGDMVSLLPGAEVSVDVEELDAAAARAAVDGGPEAATAAVELYGGDLLPEDLYEPWTEEHRESRRLRHQELLGQAGRWDELVRLDPTDEEAHVHLMRDRLANGDRRGVLRQFDRLEETLREELGASPGKEAQELRDQALALPLAEATTDRPGRPGRRVTPVPLPPTRTVGRDADVSRVVDLLEHARVVTLLGPGGVGKTRLAVEAALRYSEATPAEACFVDLTQVDRPDLVPELVVREMGVHAGAQTDLHGLLREALRGRSLLLLLDNYEHVVEAGALAGEMARWSDGVRVLCTSRARLHVAGEHVVDVAPLSLAADDRALVDGASVGDAVELFAQVATAADPSFDLTRSLDDVVAICRTLDGLPLAIELAAGHVRTLPPSLLRTRLATRLGSRSGTLRDAPARQQTIPATIDWSLQLLGPEERRLFARLGVFTTAVPVQAVEAICTDEECSDVIGALGRLVDQSLVRRVPGPREGEWRFGLLELLRERARELLVGVERAQTEERHARYVGRVSDELDEDRWTLAADRWIDLTNEFLSEIRQGHAWAERNGEVELAARLTADLGTFWHREGHYAEGLRWVTASLAHEDELSPDTAARLRLAAGFVEWPRDQLVARRHWEEAVDRFRSLGHQRYLAYALALTSVTYVGDRDAYGLGMRLCDESIELARGVGERPLIAQALNIRGELARVHGDDDTARVAYLEGRDLALAALDRTHLCFFLANLGYLADHRGEYDEARRLGCESLRISWALGRRMMSAWTVSELAGPEVGLGRPERGALLVGAADRALEMLGVFRHPSDRPEHDRVLASLEAALGQERFASLRAQGAELSLAEAVALALSGDPSGDTGTNRRHPSADESAQALAGATASSRRS